MMYLSMAIHNIAVMIFTAYMVIHVHPIWAVCILFTHRIGTKIVRVPIEEEDDTVDDSNESGRDEFKNIEKTLKDNGLYEAYDDMVLIKQALIERDRKIYGLQQHNRNLEDKLGRIGGYHYGNPKK